MDKDLSRLCKTILCSSHTLVRCHVTPPPAPCWPPLALLMSHFGVGYSCYVRSASMLLWVRAISVPVATLSGVSPWSSQDTYHRRVPNELPSSVSWQESTVRPRPMTTDASLLMRTAPYPTGWPDWFCALEHRFVPRLPLRMVLAVMKR